MPSETSREDERQATSGRRQVTGATFVSFPLLLKAFCLHTLAGEDYPDAVQHVVDTHTHTAVALSYSLSLAGGAATQSSPAAAA